MEGLALGPKAKLPPADARVTPSSWTPPTVTSAAAPALIVPPVMLPLVRFHAPLAALSVAPALFSVPATTMFAPAAPVNPPRSPGVNVPPRDSVELGERLIVPALCQWLKR